MSAVYLTDSKNNEGSPPTCSSLPCTVRPTTFHCSVYFQGNNGGVWSFLDYVEDILIGSLFDGQGLVRKKWCCA